MWCTEVAGGAFFTFQIEVSGDIRDHDDYLAGDRMKPTRLIITLATLAVLVGCNGTKNESTTSSQPDPPLVNDDSFGVDLAEARRGFTTKLNRRGPAPQEFEEATPPAGVKEVHYTSGELKLKAWLSEDPGVYEGFYGEVDDAIAAGRFVSELSYVDKDNVFVAGHSVGGLLAVLTAMMPSNYKASAALSAFLDMASWSEFEHPSRVIFDTSNPEEIRLRNPMAFPASLRIPLILYAERGGMGEINAAFVARPKTAGKPCELLVTEGDHMSMVAPSVQHAIQWYRKYMKKGDNRDGVPFGL
jgi:hypothetical protein